MADALKIPTAEQYDVYCYKVNSRKPHAAVTPVIKTHS